MLQRGFGWCALLGFLGCSAASARFGTAVAGVGDNNDGYDDVVPGPKTNSWFGYSMRAATLAASHSYVLVGAPLYYDAT